MCMILHKAPLFVSFNYSHCGVLYNVSVIYRLVLQYFLGLLLSSSMDSKQNYTQKNRNKDLL